MPKDKYRNFVKGFMSKSKSGGGHFGRNVKARGVQLLKMQKQTHGNDKTESLNIWRIANDNM